MASVETDNGDTGKRNDFEATASYLVKYDPEEHQARQELQQEAQSRDHA